MTHGCTLREDDVPCVCEDISRSAEGAVAPTECAYRYPVVAYSPSEAQALNEAYSLRRNPWATA